MYVTVTFCEYLVFPQDFITKLKLYSAKYLEQEGIAGLYFSSSLYAGFSSIEDFSSGEISRLCHNISDMFFISPCFTDFSDTLF